MDPAEAAKPLESPQPVADAPADAERRAAEARTSFNDQLVIYAALLVAVGSFLRSRSARVKRLTPDTYRQMPWRNGENCFRIAFAGYSIAPYVRQPA